MPNQIKARSVVGFVRGGSDGGGGGSEDGILRCVYQGLSMACHIL